MTPPTLSNGSIEVFFFFFVLLSSSQDCNSLGRPSVMSQHRQSTQFPVCPPSPGSCDHNDIVQFVAWFHAESWSHSRRPLSMSLSSILFADYVICMRQEWSVFIWLFRHLIIRTSGCDGNPSSSFICFHISWDRLMGSRASHALPGMVNSGSLGLLQTHL